MRDNQRKQLTDWRKNGKERKKEYLNKWIFQHISYKKVVKM